ncbi:type IV pilus modification PilV family protein [Flexistipes sp.]|uniref:type IV pilus modification PilV family protein n=1 Tax=Flexistipes sp. TaxID=3088135 RepID=UPI002E2270D0|nr:prepilin-type N-terminal cleavage/methylation domain-containing protein [Flexistipes sp.]
MNKGFTIIELMVAMLIFAVAMLGLVSGAIQVKKISLNNMLRNEAVRIAADTFENARNVIDVNSLDNTGDCAGGCDPAGSDNCTVSRYIRNGNVKFGKIVEVTGSDLKKVEVNVCWDFFGDIKKHSAVSYIRN